MTVEAASPAASANDNLPELFADGLCIAADSEVLDSNVTAIVAAIYNRTTGETIYSEEGTRHMAQASITKLMTCYVALKYGNLSDVITVKGEWLANLDSGSSVCGIKDGDEITLEQLIYGLLIPSGNDAANAIAYYISGSEEAFVQLMNEEAHLLGMTDSHFVNAHGLDDPDHYTTAYDIYLVFNQLLDNQFFRQVIGTQDYTAIYSNNGATVTQSWQRGIWYFTNPERPLPDYLMGVGGKTGTTDNALFCLAFCTLNRENGDEYISIVLKSGSRERLYNNMDLLFTKIAN
jgi:D-alanyl-D-alanine carboxypeptidase